MLIEISFDMNGNKQTKIVYDKDETHNQSNIEGNGSEFTVINKNDFDFDEKTKIVKLFNSVVYVPNYKVDLIQSGLSRGGYFDAAHLKKMSKYLNDDSVVLDCGANIGNHTLYFANECNVKKIYAFEPVPSTYKILEKNIKLNKLKKKVKLFNVGLSDKVSNASIASYNITNIGGTRICEDEDGELNIVTIDSLKIKDKIDFIKIDVEGMDYHVLQGAEKTIRKNMPVINIESFSTEHEQSGPFLKNLGYELAEELSCCEYIYTPVKNKKS